MSWIEVRATFSEVPEDWSPLVDVFLRHGIENSLQTDVPPALTACVVEVEGSESVVSALVDDLYDSGAAEVETKPYEEQDWEEAWKKFFVPRRVGRRFVIVPTWESFASGPGDLVITLDPGQAFGTGDHPTTRMCLALMEDVPVAGASVLDVGCGSGILSVGACLLGAGSVLAVDIEPLSVEVARENAALNGVSFKAVVWDGVPDSSVVYRRSSVVGTDTGAAEGADDVSESELSEGTGGVSGADPHLPPRNRSGRDGDGLGARNSEHGTGESELGAGNSELGTGESELEAGNLELGTRGRGSNLVMLSTTGAPSSETRAPRFEFDLVLSNIISAALIKIAPDVQAVTHEGSRWIVSGILEGNWPDVLEAAKEQGFTLERKLEEDGWVAATFRR